MPDLQYVHLNVFTNQPFTGNQLAVFLDAEGIEEKRMQPIANEMAFPETTLVFSPEGPGVNAYVRIFTPSQELPMAGSPAVGTTFALAGAGRLRAGATVYSRLFAPVLGISEDPATGSASGPLGAYLLKYNAVSSKTESRLVSLQGVRMGRPSHIHIALSSRAGVLEEVQVGGEAVVIGEGKIRA